MADPKTKTGVPVRDFNDAGSGETFEKGKSYDFSAGAHANYLVAGLIEAPETRAPAKSGS